MPPSDFGCRHVYLPFLILPMICTMAPFPIVGRGSLCGSYGHRPLHIPHFCDVVWRSTHPSRVATAVVTFALTPRLTALAPPARIGRHARWPFLRRRTLMPVATKTRRIVATTGTSCQVGAPFAGVANEPGLTRTAAGWSARKNDRMSDPGPIKRSFGLLSLSAPARA
jgi:hypothetical protein